jgi:hypothetical protein
MPAPVSRMSETSTIQSPARLFGTIRSSSVYWVGTNRPFSYSPWMSGSFPALTNAASPDFDGRAMPPVGPCGPEPSGSTSP